MIPGVGDRILTILVLGGIGYLIYLKFAGKKHNLNLKFLLKKDNSILGKGKGI